MGHPAVNTVFHNDYIMTYILRMLDRKQQYELLTISHRLRFLVVTCVWGRDCKEMQMNRNEMYHLSNDEYFELLRLNADNTEKLIIDAFDGGNNSIEMYFQTGYANLLQLHIKNFKLDDNVLSNIVSKCPKLQLFDYTEFRDDSLHETELQSLELLWPLADLRAVVLRNLYRPLSLGELYLLATKVPLERLELYNVPITKLECDESSCTMDLEGMQVLKIRCGNKNGRTLLEFLKKCPNLQELEFDELNETDESFFANFKHLEKVKIENGSDLIVWYMLRDVKLKHLEIESIKGTHPFTIPEGDCSLGANFCSINAAIIDNKTFLPTIFQSPFTNFENLHELTLVFVDIDDSFMQSLSQKSRQLKVLHLDECKITGKYINDLTNIESLAILKNTEAMPWSNLYAILRDLKLLKHLNMDGKCLTRDVFTIQLPVQQLANSLEDLAITRQENVTNFWKFILDNCEDSFKNVHTFKIDTCPPGNDTVFNYCNFVHKFKLLRLELQILNDQSLYEEKFISPQMMPTLQHLILRNCSHLQWPHIVNIFQCTNLETFEIFCRFNRLPAYWCQFSFPAEHNFKITKDIRKITLPYFIFIKTHIFWRRFLEECPALQLCCVGHRNHTEILTAMLENFPAKERIAAIHANSNLESIKLYCAENMSSVRIPVHSLDNSRLWNPGFAFAGCVLIVETNTK